MFKILTQYECKYTNQQNKLLLREKRQKGIQLRTKRNDSISMGNTWSLLERIDLSKLQQDQTSQMNNGQVNM